MHPAAFMRRTAMLLLRHDDTGIPIDINQGLGLDMPNLWKDVSSLLKKQVVRKGRSARD